MRSLISLSTFFASHPLTSNAPYKAWIRFVDWQIRSRLHEEVVVAWVGGQKLAIRRGMTGATGNIYVGLHEFVDMAFLLHFLRNDDLFLDIGSNVGSFTVLASGVCGAETWSFEPDPDTARYLRRNVSINDLNGRVTVYETALGSHNGEATFTVGLDSVNRVLPSPSGGGRTVKISKLDDIVGMGRPTMAKIDVEGYEDHVLDGATSVLGSNLLKAIEVETVTPNVTSVLRTCGFERAYYDPFTRQIERSPAGPPASNALYVRDWEFVGDRLRTARKFRILDTEI